MLGVAAEGTEVVAAEIAESGESNFSFSVEVMLMENALDPDIDGEGAEALEGKEEDAVGDLFSDAGEAAELAAGFIIGEGAQGFEIEFAGGDHAGGFEEIAGAVAEGAGAEVWLSEGGEA